MKRKQFALTAVAQALRRGFWSLAEAANDRLFDFGLRQGFILAAAHTAVASFTDTTYAICATLPATYDSAGYGATSLTYTAIGKVESFPEFGSERSVAEFRPISGTVEKAKGSPNYGGGQMVMGDVPADAGQVILKAAEASANHYSIKITYPDGEVHYLDVLVTAWKLAQAAEGAFMKRTGGLQLCRVPVIVAAS